MIIHRTINHHGRVWWWIKAIIQLWIALRSNVSTFLPKFTKVRSNMSENKEEFDPVTAHSEILDCLEDSKKNF